MSTTQDLVRVLKSELKAAGITYAILAERLGMAESSIKRVFARADMPLSRIDEVLRVLKMDFAELARKVADAQPLATELTLEQEKAVVADRKLLLLAICCLSEWTLKDVVETYQVTEAECIKYFAQLDRLGIIELRPLNRYRLRVAKGFRWRPRGPVMTFFRRHMADEFLDASFDGSGETLTLVHGQITAASAELLVERLRRIGQDFAQQHLAEQHLPEEQLHPFTLLIGMRTWLFSGLKDLKR